MKTKNLFKIGVGVLFLFMITFPEKSNADCWDCDNIPSPSYCSYNYWFVYVCGPKFESPMRKCNLQCSLTGCNSDSCQAQSTIAP